MNKTSHLNKLSRLSNSRWSRLWQCSACLVGLASFASSAAAVQVAVTVRNAAPENGIWAVNPWLGIHDGTYDVFDVGSAASAAVESAAEDGSPALQNAAFASAQPNGLAAVIGGPVAPGRGFTQIFDLDPSIASHRYLSYFAMVIPSNDAFWGNDNPTGYPIFDDNGNFIPRSFKVYGSMVWDAGTETNDEVPANTAFLAQAGPNTGGTEGGVVAIHPGFMAAGMGGILDATSMAPGVPVTFQAGDFKQAMYPVAEITISLVNGETKTPSRLLNMSSRGVAGSGDNTQVVGFVVSAGEDKQVLVRAVGPGLAQFNVAGFLADPSVTIFNSANEAMGTNDNWVAAEVGEATAAVGAFALDAASADAAIMMTLPAGAYTAHVGNSSGSDGVVLVEFFEVGN